MEQVEAVELEYCDVEPILAEHCTKCHNDSDDARGPMSLETYEDVLEWKRDVGVWVNADLMPPRQSSIPVVITTEERDILVEWSRGPATQGNCD